MAEFITEKRLSDMTAGERRVAKCLKSLLSDDCTIWYDIPIGEKRLHPDFVVLMPSRGLLVLEVKDWKPDTLKSLNPVTATIETPNGIKAKDNPLEQARAYIFSIIDTLKTIPELREPVESKYQGEICFPYSYGAVFTNITRQQLHQAIPEESRGRLLPDRYLICKNDIGPSATAEGLQKLLLNMFKHEHGEPLTDEQINCIRWCLFPEIRIQPDMFFGPIPGAEQTAEPAVAETEPVNYTLPEPCEPVPDIVKVMDLQQEQLARGLGEGHRVIHGVAGSGKTIILYHRCMQLADLMKKTILVLCFNITLSQKLQAAIEQRGIKNVEVRNFHAWCDYQIKKYKVRLANNKEKFWERQVKTMIKAVEEGKIPKGQYGAILIDEGHDFEPEWLKLAVQMVDPITNSLLLLYDDAQSIYKTKPSLNFSLASVGIKAQGRTSILRVNYRNTREILQFAYQFAKNYFPESNNSDIPVLVPETVGNIGDKPVVKHFKGPQIEITNTLTLLEKLHKQGKSWVDIAIISPTIKTIKDMAEELDKKDIPYQLLSSRESKKSYRPNINKVTLVATPSSKGLEFDVVIILDASFVYDVDEEKGKEDTADHLLNSIRHLYVAMTRAQNHLFISYWKKNKIAELIEQCQNTA